MDKTTLKIVGARLRREFAAVDKLPFPLQQALAELARREADTFAAAKSDEPPAGIGSGSEQQRPWSRR